MLNTELQIIYTDLKTGRIARIANFPSLTTPAEIEETNWKVFGKRLIPTAIEKEIQMWEVTINRKFVRHDEPLDQEELKRISRLNTLADTLETASKTINGMRYTRTSNMVGNDMVIAEYLKEIEEYKSSGNIGALLNSLADNEEDIPAAIVEFEIKHTTFINFLVSSEIFWNKTTRRLKQAADPAAELEEIKKSLGL